MLRARILQAVSLFSALSLTVVAAILHGCSVYGGSSFHPIVRRSKVSIAASTPIVLSGKHVAFLADEATTGPGGTDMNGDGDTTDSIAVVIDMATKVETRLDVAATALAWAGSELFLVVDESLDGRDWNGNGNTTDLVLLHISAAGWTGTPPAVADFDVVDRLATAGSTKIVSLGTNVFYSSFRAPANPTESNLFVISSASPTAPTMVPTTDAAGPLSPRILAKDEGLIFLGLDETSEGRDLNGDGDALDTNVLALMDGTLAATTVRGAGLAMPAAGWVLRARRATTNPHDWSVGFLVSEADQGGTNLNDPALFAGAWEPPQCVGFEDSDARDCVLHYLQFAPWVADPVANPPVNTGLVGCRKIAIANDFIATITPEIGAADPNGAEGGCDLNGDGDTLDYVVRWVRMDPASVLPLTSAANLHALTDVPGGTHGLAELGIRFVLEVSEAQDDRDIDGDGAMTSDLVGWLQPSGAASSNTPWDFTHPLSTAGVAYAGASWMAEIPDRTRMNVAFEESVRHVDFNGDGDEIDSLPTFPFFNGSPASIRYPGVDVALQTGNAGMVTARGICFYRASESEDSRDWNADGLETGFILFRTSMSDGFPFEMGPLNSIANRPAVEFNAEESTPVGCAFIADEQLQGPSGTDLNGDGDATDLVLSYFVF